MENISEVEVSEKFLSLCRYRDKKRALQDEELKKGKEKGMKSERDPLLKSLLEPVEFTIDFQFENLGLELPSIVCTL